MHSSISISMLAAALVQVVAAVPYQARNNTEPIIPYPTGPTAPPYPTGPTAISPSPNTTHTEYPSPYYTSIETSTKTITWTINVPCTTVLPGGSTSYYTTASVYTTTVPSYHTVTVTNKPACAKGHCYTPLAPTTTSYPSACAGGLCATPGTETTTTQAYTPPTAYYTNTPDAYNAPASVCPSLAHPSTVTVYAPTTVTATTTITYYPSPSPPTTTPAPTAPVPIVCHHNVCHETVCKNGKCEVVTTYTTLTFGNWNGTSVNTGYYPTGTGSGTVGTGTEYKY